MFAVIVLIIIVPGALLVGLGGSRGQGVGVGLLGASVVLSALGTFAVRERRRQLERRGSMSSQDPPA